MHFELKEPAVRALLENVDYKEIKYVQGACTLREFMAGTFSYTPGWLRGLFAIRGVVARIFGLEHERFDDTRMAAQDVPFTPGDKAPIFEVVSAEEDRYWIGDVADRHLAAQFAVEINQGADGMNTFACVTTVTYRNWKGPLYFKLILPFHHLVVNASLRYAANGGGKN